MNCDRALELLALGESSEELEEHLAVCVSCREAREQLAMMQAAFGELEFSAPEGFAQSVMDRVRAETPEKKIIPLFKRPRFKALAGLAACAVLAIGMYSASQNRAQNDWVLTEEKFSIDSRISADSLDDEEPGPESCMMTRAVPEPDDAFADGIMPLDGVDQAVDLVAERWSAHAAMVLERLPDGAAELIGPEVAVSYNEETGEEGYSWLTEGGPEALGQIERLAGEQGMCVERSSAPAEKLWYDLVVFEPDR